jgi:hypothetical protein
MEKIQVGNNPVFLGGKRLGFQNFIEALLRRFLDRREDHKGDILLQPGKKKTIKKKQGQAKQDTVQ